MWQNIEADCLILNYATLDSRSNCSGEYVLVSIFPEQKSFLRKVYDNSEHVPPPSVSGALQANVSW